MKKIIFRMLAATAVLVLAAVACSKKDNTPNPGNKPDKPGNTGSIIMTASVEDAVTKTSLGAADGAGKRQVSWVDNDEVKVLYSGGSTTSNAANVDSEGKAQFNFDAPSGDVWFTYPSSAGSLDAGVLSLDIPAVQDGSFAAHSYLVAKALTSDAKIVFFNACSMFKIVVDDAAIKQAVITGNNNEKLAGTVSYTWEGANNQAPTADVTAATGTSITVNFNGTGEYLVAALPGLNLTAGATIKFYKEGETAGTYDLPAGGNRSSAALSVARAQIASWGNSNAICHRYVSTTASGTDNGRAADKAWNTDQFVGFLAGKWNGADTDADKLEAMNGVTVHIAAGSYTLPNADINLGSAFTNMTVVAENGATFAGNGNLPILHQNRTNRAGTTILFDSITFSGGRRSGDHGGAIYHSYGTLKYKNCNFTDNQTVTDSKNGGALHFYTSPTAIFEDCTFSGNKANGASANGGVLNITGNPTLTFTRCAFYNNTATQDGGVVNINGAGVSARFEDCDFGDGTDGNKNSTTNNGGVFLIEKASSLYIVNCRFNGNTAKGGAALNFPSSATVGADAVHVQGCSFTGNSATNNGGVIRMVGGTLNLEKNVDVPCTFTGNSVPNTNTGGVFYFEGNSTLNDNGSVYKQNHALWGGVAGIATDIAATVNMEACVFGTDGTSGDKNYAVQGGGVFNLNGGTVNLTKCKFYGNEAQTRPGGVLRRSTDGSGTVNVNIYGCTFKENRCSWTNKDSATGGAISFDKGNLTIQKAADETRNTFLNNTSIYRGGAIEVGGTAIAVIKDSDFTGNTTTGENYSQVCGGALNVSGSADVEVSDCTFIGNQASDAGYGGGAIGAFGGTDMIIKFNKCLFKDNYAAQGGALANYSKGTVYMNACAFTGNYAKGNFGCVMVLTNVSSATITLCMNNCSFADNQYSVNGDTGQRCSWINMKALTKLVLSNSTLIGVTRKTSGLTPVLDSSTSLLRFDGNVGTGNYIINSIIAIKSADTANYASDIKGSPVTGYYNKLSALMNGTTYTAGEGCASDFRGTSTYFGGLGTSMTEGAAATDCYWSWNGTLANGSDNSKAKLSDVKNKIKDADEDFYNWLKGLGSTGDGALDQDCRGQARGETVGSDVLTWPGAYGK